MLNTQNLDLIYSVYQSNEVHRSPLSNPAIRRVLLVYD